MLNGRPASIDRHMPPHLIVMSDELRLHEFMSAIGPEAAKFMSHIDLIYLASEELDPRPLNAQVAEMLCASLYRAPIFRRFVIDQGGIAETRKEETFREVAAATAGTVLCQYLERKAAGEGSVTTTR